MKLALRRIMLSKLNDFHERECVHQMDSMRPLATNSPSTPDKRSLSLHALDQYYAVSTVTVEFDYTPRLKAIGGDFAEGLHQRKPGARALKGLTDVICP